MATVQPKLKASSLLEVVVAMTIVVTIFTLTISLIVKLLSGGTGGGKLKNYLLVHHRHTTTVKNRVAVKGEGNIKVSIDSLPAGIWQVKSAFYDTAGTETVLIRQLILGSK